jgi:hypothetical protein
LIDEIEWAEKKRTVAAYMPSIAVYIPDTPSISFNSNKN